MIFDKFFGKYHKNENRYIYVYKTILFELYIATILYTFDMKNIT